MLVTGLVKGTIKPGLNFQLNAPQLLFVNFSSIPYRRLKRFDINFLQ